MSKKPKATTDGPQDDSKVGTDYDPFRFDPQVRKEAWSRQDGRCGICGRRLEVVMQGNVPNWPDNDRVEAHHVISRNSAKLIDTNTQEAFAFAAFIKSADNCMYLCGDCHLHRAHGHDFGEGGLRPPELFPYSHGGAKKAERKQWLARAKEKWIQLYKPKKGGTKA